MFHPTGNPSTSDQARMAYLHKRSAGIQEPRKVLLLVATDIHDPNKQLSRTVCTYPAKGKMVCRDWDTGKLIAGDNEQ